MLNTVRIFCGVGLMCLVPLAKAGTAYNVSQFGAKGDGVTDNYAALQAAAAAVCKSPGSSLLFPPGTYRIKGHRVIYGTRQNTNTVKDIQYIGCNGVTISGYGAKIDVEGSFSRNADYYPDPSYAVSFDEGIIPFYMINSTGFSIVGFELDGNVDTITRNPIVIEGFNAGVMTRNCTNYQLRDLYIHHFHTDGISLGHGSSISDRGAVVANVIVKNNARQGLSVIQVRDARISGSQFIDTGKTGAYGLHKPTAGADVEPERAPPAVDVATGLIDFDNCRFEENLGSQFISTWPQRVESVTVRNSVIRATIPEADAAAFLNAAANSTVTGNTFYLGAKKAVVLGPTMPGNYTGLVQVLYSGNTLNLADRYGIYSPIKAAPVVFTGNIVNVNSTKPETSFLMLNNFSSATSNTFSVAAAGYAGATSTLPYVIVFQAVKTVSGNQYKTDLAAGKKYYTIYYGSGISVSGETFGSTFSPLTVK